jgi:hypothetical protein
MLNGRSGFTEYQKRGLRIQLSGRMVAKNMEGPDFELQHYKTIK